MKIFFLFMPLFCNSSLRLRKRRMLWLFPDVPRYLNSPLPKVGVFVSIFIFVYLSSLPVAHLSDAPRRRLVVTGDSARIQDETTENSAWFFNVLGV